MFDAVRARALVAAYNQGKYRGCGNTELDEVAYRKFQAGLSDDEASIVEQIRFVGECYGGAQRRFLPHDYVVEARLIAAKLRAVLDLWRNTVRAARPLSEEAPTEPTLRLLLGPFHRTHRWPVWASKILHFLRPDVFPILDSRAKEALNLTGLGSAPRDYYRFCVSYRETMIGHRDALGAAREVDRGKSLSELKVFDKILFELGG